MRRAIFAGLAALSLVPLLRAWSRGRAARSLRRWQDTALPAEWPSVSIVIPAWCECATLEACLTALSHEQYEPDCEIIVVAGGSDGTLEAARHFARSDRRVRVLEQRPDGGKNGAMNDGARLAVGEILVFLDADTIVTADWLRSLVASLGPDYAASTGRFVSRRRTLIARAQEMSQVLEDEVRGRVLLQGSGAMAVRKAVFARVGGIPEGPYADDWVLSERLIHAGHKIAFAPSAVSFSERPATLGEWWRNELRWRRFHLLSLFQIANGELATPLSAAKALYPYASAWAGLSLTAIALTAKICGLRLGPAIRVGWLGFTVATMVREAAGPLEMIAYTGQARWLEMSLALPFLTVLGWTPTVLATLTTERTRLHFKGPRRPVAVPHGPVPFDAAPSTAVESAFVGEVRVETGP